ncbi:unnamed protein product [Nippostrongylus brasiliensis]|uniref:ANF_receptor domain-containing protein n=1 Tax=Nippostrongylus brasiliensis TaxID=27835 RepID=A0A0N4Y346_NIPBR|nr:unnamed protein product [Nippostrongylus brasiliensis]
MWNRDRRHLHPLRPNSVLLNSLVILLLAAISPLPFVTVCDADASSDTEIIKKLLNKGYDWRVRPPGINLTAKGSDFLYEQCQEE